MVYCPLTVPANMRNAQPAWSGAMDCNLRSMAGCGQRGADRSRRDGAVWRKILLELASLRSGSSGTYAEVGPDFLKRRPDWRAGLLRRPIRDASYAERRQSGADFSLRHKAPDPRCWCWAHAAALVRADRSGPRPGAAGIRLAYPPHGMGTNRAKFTTRHGALLKPSRRQTWKRCCGSAKTREDRRLFRSGSRRRPTRHG